MLDFGRFIGGLMADILRARAALMAENAMLRQQLIVAERKIRGFVGTLRRELFPIRVDPSTAPGPTGATEPLSVSFSPVSAERARNE
ncbi:MAG TPA: hypothetical protein VM580_23690 [Labilithrix sp.]|nr:hypothetical protein [Labilithrix sp.]